ncbi:hypothetical protein, partial [Paraburkholderia aspalathi]|uniref:hypothetical protein n=1 Tax=Paraburkholderia aspalathi TaxID=1324617 RepID=UPI001ABEEE0C
SRTSLHCMPSPTLPDWYINTQTTDHHAVEIFGPDHCRMIFPSMVCLVAVGVGTIAQAIVKQMAQVNLSACLSETLGSRRKD